MTGFHSTLHWSDMSPRNGSGFDLYSQQRAAFAVHQGIEGSFRHVLERAHTFMTGFHSTLHWGDVSLGNGNI